MRLLLEAIDRERQLAVFDLHGLQPVFVQVFMRGDETEVTARLEELLASGLDELLLTAVPMGDPAGERTRLVQFAGRL